MERIAVVPSARRHFSPHPVARPMSGPMSPARPGETLDLATRRAAAVAMSPRAVWKAIEPDFDRTPQMSFSQEKMAYIPPAPGTTPTKHRRNGAEFSGYVDKAVKLNVDLKSRNHE
jgi:hypothetical protein